MESTLERPRTHAPAAARTAGAAGRRPVTARRLETGAARTAKKLLLPSLMCADASRLGQEVADLEAAGADGFHLDVMDGSFVPNWGMGLAQVDWVCRNAHVPSDVHLMVEHPGRHVARFAEAGARVIYVHGEADRNVARTLQAIRDLSVHPGVAVNPGTSFSAVEPVLPLVDYVLVMTVNPGFAGQAYLPFVDEKIDAFVAASQRHGYEVVIDGSCSPKGSPRRPGAGPRGSSWAPRPCSARGTTVRPSRP